MSGSGSKTKVVTTENVTITARAQETTETSQTAETTRRRPRVMFTADTVDNENMGKKSSKGKLKICQEFCHFYSVVMLAK